MTTPTGKCVHVYTQESGTDLIGVLELHRGGDRRVAAVVDISGDEDTGAGRVRMRAAGSTVDREEVAPRFRGLDQRRSGVGVCRVYDSTD